MSSSRQPRTVGGWLIAVVVAWLALVPVATAAAQKGKAKRAPVSRRVVEVEEVFVEGRIQKPSAFYILNRSSVQQESLDLRTSFVHKVVATVKREPF